MIGSGLVLTRNTFTNKISEISTGRISKKILSIFLITVMLGSFSSFPVYAEPKNPETPVGPPGVPADIQDLEDQVDVLDQTVIELQNQINGIDDEIADLQAEDVNLQNQIDSLDTRVDSLETRATALENKGNDTIEAVIIALAAAEVIFTAGGIGCVADASPACATAFAALAVLATATIVVLEIIVF